MTLLYFDLYRGADLSAGYRVVVQAGGARGYYQGGMPNRFFFAV